MMDCGTKWKQVKPGRKRHRVRVHSHSILSALLFDFKIDCFLFPLVLREEKWE